MTYSQLDLPHGTKHKRVMKKKLKTKNEMLRKKRFSHKVRGVSPEIQKRYQKTLLRYNNEPDLLR